MSTAAPIIRAEGLTRRFGDFTAVDDLTIRVVPGSIFAFLGANGSGKSTTIRMLIGLLTPTAGRIEVDGIDVIRHPRRVRDHIGYMGQKVSLYQGLTLRENVEFYAGLYGLSPAALEERWGALRERLSLAPFETEKPDKLPAGVRQRAGLALSTLHRPRVLFLDEPTAGVDVHNRTLFWELIQEEADSGVTIFVTTHFLEEADYCDWVSFIDEGRLTADASPEGLRSEFSPGYRIRIEAAAGAPAREAAAGALALDAAAGAVDDATGAAAALRGDRASAPTGEPTGGPGSGGVDGGTGVLAAFARELEGLGVDVAFSAPHLEIRMPSLDAGLLRRVGDLERAHPLLRVTIRQPQMTDIFRELAGRREVRA